MKKSIKNFEVKVLNQSSLVKGGAFRKGGKGEIIEKAVRERG